MPNTESAKKRVRQNAKRNARNNWRKRTVKVETKAFLDAVASGDAKAAEAQFRKVAGLLDRVGCSSTMHRNTVARRKSLLARKLNAMAAAT